MANLASYFDHTLLRPGQDLGDFTQAYRDATQYGFKSICVSSAMVPLMSKIMFSKPKNQVVLCETVGFPHGTSIEDAKLVEINQGIRLGVTEFDLVPLLNAVKSGDWNHYEKEIVLIREATRTHTLKVILEVALLTDDEVKRCCDICISSGVDFVKTSTGFLKQLTPVETARYVKLMADCVLGTQTQVKASGWIRTLADARLMLEAGATRIGASNTVAIMKELELENG